MSEDDMPVIITHKKRTKNEFDSFTEFLYIEEPKAEKAIYNKKIDYIFVEKSKRYAGLCAMHKIEKKKDIKLFGTTGYTLESVYVRPSFRK